MTVKRAATVDVVRRDRCDHILDLLQQFPDPVPVEVRNRLRDYFLTRGIQISESSATRYIRRLPHSSHDEIIAEFVEQNLTKILFSIKTVPSTYYSHRKLIQDLISNPNTIDERIRISTNDALPKSARISAIRSLLGATEDHFSRIRGIDGEYYGYRRSTNEGDIIRFHIRIDNDPDGMLTFVNRYRRDGNGWIVRGFGFGVDRIIYLVGHAVSDSNSDVGLGIRCFALSRYALGGWLIGPILSVDRFGSPLAARVVLIPVTQHVGVEAGQTVSQMIEKDITPEMIDKEIKITDIDGGDVFKRIPCSLYVRALIWNGTFTTVPSLPEPIFPSQLDDYERLFEMQGDMINLMKNSGSVIGPFLRIAASYSETPFQDIQKK